LGDKLVWVFSWHDLNEIVGYCHGTLENGDNSHVGCVPEIDKENNEGDEVEVRGVVKWRMGADEVEGHGVINLRLRSWWSWRWGVMNKD